MKIVVVLALLVLASCGGSSPKRDYSGGVYPAEVMGHAKSVVESITIFQLEVRVNRGSEVETVLVTVEKSAWKELKVGDKIVVKRATIPGSNGWRYHYELAGRYEKPATTMK